MKLVDMKVSEFLEELASKSPAPGGGSVSALAGANAASLIMMVSELSTKKKKFKALEEKIQNQYLDTIKVYDQNRQKFIEFVDEDTKAFNLIMEAFKMPKESEAEQTERKAAIYKATVACIKVPMQVCLTALESLRYMEFIIEYSNKNTLSDQGVATLLFYSAFEGASMNVLTNLIGLEDEALKKDYQQVISKMSIEAKELKEDILEKVYYLLK